MGVNKRILKLAVPSILANITVPIVGMVDIAVSGRLGNVAAIGAIAIGSMLFDLLYWNFGFLRMGTGGLTAQAYGRKNLRDAMRFFTQGIATAIVSALFLIAIQWLFINAAFVFIDCTPEVEQLARRYFYIRIWAAPATLSLFVFKGWFIGMQNTVSPMAIDIVVNVINLVASIYLGLHTSLGFAGISVGTVISQYSGLLLAIVLLTIYYRKLFHYVDIRHDVKFRYMRDFYVVNANLFFRSLCFMLIYGGFTAIAARYGDLELAVSSIMMKLFMLYSYFLDGFAYAGQALAGKYIGARDRPALTKTIKYLFIWTAVLVALSTLAYALWGDTMVSIMAPAKQVVEASQPYRIWLILMPLFSCAAFMWDGIYIGATATTAIRNCMIWACLLFYIVYFLTKNAFGIQSLYAGYFAHILIRDIYLTLRLRKDVYAKIA